MAQNESPTELVQSSPEEDEVQEMVQPLQGQIPLVPVETTEDVDFDLLDRAYNHLQSQGMGTLELAVQDEDDSGQIAKQICDELGVPCPSYLVETVRDGVVQQRASGAHASQLTWERISPPLRTKELVPVEQPEWKPPPGERNRKLLDEGCISLAREERLQELYGSRSSNWS